MNTWEHTISILISVGECFHNINAIAKDDLTDLSPTAIIRLKNHHRKVSHHMVDFYTLANSVIENHLTTWHKLATDRKLTDEPTPTLTNPPPETRPITNDAIWAGPLHDQKNFIEEHHIISTQSQWKDYVNHQLLISQTMDETKQCIKPEVLTSPSPRELEIVIGCIDTVRHLNHKQLLILRLVSMIEEHNLRVSWR